MALSQSPWPMSSRELITSSANRADRGIRRQAESAVFRHLRLFRINLETFAWFKGRLYTSGGGNVGMDFFDGLTNHRRPDSGSVIQPMTFN